MKAQSFVEDKLLIAGKQLQVLTLFLINNLSNVTLIIGIIKVWLTPPDTLPPKARCKRRHRRLHASVGTEDCMQASAPAARR